MKKKTCKSGREESEQAENKSLAANKAEPRVVRVLISCLWKRELYQDWNTTFNESLTEA